MSLNIFKQRREHFYQQLKPDSIAVITSAPDRLRNGDAHYPYRQNSYFYYLTGFQAPDAAAIFIPEKQSGRFIFFCKPSDRVTDIWLGPRLNPSQAITTLGADAAAPFGEFPEQLSILLKKKKHIYYPINKALYDPLLISWIEQLCEESSSNKGHLEIHSLEPLIAEQRLYKDPYEIEQMRKAAQISAEAHVAAMHACRPGKMEYELEAVLLSEFCKRGARSLAYESIVASGKNACILHYTKNNARLNDGELVLIDAGCEYELYASDISRTFPVNGRFNPQQKALYEIVLAAQRAGINAAQPGRLWSRIQQTIIKVLTEGFIELGIFKGDVSTLIEQQAYREVYMHNSGHWLGLDVHDVGEYKVNETSRILEPGHVLTVEPGIYISENASNIAPEWHNIGIRIEDDVLITPEGNEVLSKDVPKEISDIEKIMAL